MPKLHLLLIAAALALGACSDRVRPLPQASGEWFQINPSRLASARQAMPPIPAVERRP